MSGSARALYRALVRPEGRAGKARARLQSAQLPEDLP